MQVDVSIGSAQYPFLLGTDCQDQIAERLMALSGSRYLVVGDTNTSVLYGRDLVARLSRYVPANLLTHAVGEPHKSLEAVNSLIESALALGADRASVVVAIGGGVTGNMAGLMAALLFRGIRLVHVPTTLLAMLDSVLSLKQAVNARVGKNLIGTFYAPTEVLADVAALRTLPREEIVAGLCEVIKNSLAIKPEMIPALLEWLREDACYDNATLHAIIAASIQAKASVTAEDEHESRAAMVLEYGHTIGHALEYTAAGRLSHGMAVGLGMIAAAKIAQRLSYLDVATAELHVRLLFQAGALLTIPADIDVDAAAHRLMFDNKRGYLKDSTDALGMVLLSGPGKPVWLEGRPLVPVPLPLAREVMNEMAHLGRDGKPPTQPPAKNGKSGSALVGTDA